MSDYIDKYNFEALKNYVSEYIDIYSAKPIVGKGKTTEQFETERDRKETLTQYLDECYAGDIKEKEFVKLFIKQLITAAKRDSEIYIIEYPKDYKVTPDNIDKFLDVCNESNMTIDLAYRLIMNKYKKQYGLKALAKLIETYKLNELKLDEYGELRFLISKEDIVRIYEAEKPETSYEDTLDILVQLIYEQYKGLGVIDELVDMDLIDEVSYGVSGSPNEMVTKNQEIDIPKAYDSIVVTYQGDPIHFRFLSFGSWSELERVNKITVKYEQSKQFCQKEGFILGYRKNGSRVSAARPPFGENRAAWIRNFYIREVNCESLVKGRDSKKPVKGWEKVIRREYLLMRGCATTTVSGDQKIGKTTKLLGLIEYIDPTFALRIKEAVFELMARRRYPGRDIFTMAEIEGLDETEAYNFALRSSGDVIIDGELRSDKSIAQLINNGNRGSKFTLAAFHPNRADLCPIEAANAMLRLGIYQSLKEALYAVLKSLKCNVQITRDRISGNRIYELYQYQSYRLEIPDTYKRYKGQDRMEAFMDSCYIFFRNMTETEFFRTVPLVEYDRDTEQYVVCNTISDDLFDHMDRNMQLRKDRAELRKVFRPEKYIGKLLKDMNASPTPQNIEEIITAENIDAYLDIAVAAREISQRLKEGGYTV